MKKILIICIVGLVLFGSAEIVRAKEPYVYISVEQEKADLGTLLVWDTTIPEALTLKINSNCLHGAVVASMSNLKHSRGDLIMRNRIFIKSEATDGFISMEKSVVVSGPAVGSHDVVIDFKVEANGLKDRAGKYSGTIAFTIMPPV